MSVTSVGSVLVSPVTPRNDSHQVQAATQHDTSAKQPETREKNKVIHSTAADLEQISLVFDKKLRFVVDHHSHQVTVKVIDKETDKVIKELPPEELQRLHSNLKETIGFLFDERV